MELEELKNIWSSLDDRLKKQETLKETIIKEMLKAKSDKALSRLINYELIGILVLLLIIPVIIYAFDLHTKLAGHRIFMYSMFVISIVLLLWQVIKVYGLMHIDYTKPVNTNIHYANKYNIWIKKEKMVMLFLIPVVLIPCFYFYAVLNVNAFLWAFLICLSVGLVLYSIWSYKKLYDKNITSILKSLDDLKELEEKE